MVHSSFKIYGAETFAGLSVLLGWLFNPQTFSAGDPGEFYTIQRELAEMMTDGYIDVDAWCLAGLNSPDTNFYRRFADEEEK